MTLEIQELAEAMGTQWNGRARTAAGWSVDTRTQNAGDVYFALRGPNHDGHDFVAAAMEKGAAAVVVESAESAGAVVVKKPSGIADKLVVGDTLVALQRAGAWARRKWGGKVIGVTGSAGKTTTKDAIAHLLATGMPVGKTVGNLNNHVGVPLSLLRLPDACRVGVLEMGMNHAGEIRQLAEIAAPEVGVVTNVGYAHVEFFRSIEDVALAKRELIEGLPRDGVAVLNADDARVAQFGEVHPGRTVTFGFAESADVRAERVAAHAGGTRFRVAEVEYETGMVGRHAVMNLLAAIAVAQEFGIAAEGLRDAVRSFTPGKMRGERTVHNGIIVWDDCYNSNPEAAESMLDVLGETPASRRIAVLGEMLELGAESASLHRRVGRYAAALGIDFVIGVRGASQATVEAAAAEGAQARFFEDPAAAGEFVRGVARAGDAVLFKGSRGVKVERALERFLA